MRFDGILKSWNDERGFGFLQPSQGGDEIFVHIKALPGGAGRPNVGQAYTFEIETGVKGKRAKNVQLARVARTRQQAPTGPAQWGTATLFAIPAFLVVYLAVTFAWRPPAWLALVYVALSAVSFVIYAVDKSAARSNSWRVSEATLHASALACGWPGALLAQQFLRHKSSKREFRQVFSERPAIPP